MIRSFTIPKNQTEVDWIRRRVEEFRFFEEPDDRGWAHGASRAYMKKLRDYWLNAYDWPATVQRLNRLPHQIVPVAPDLSLHCVHIRSSRADAVPLLIAHGWPGSILEFEALYARLAEPEDPQAPAFHVVAPSLPGYAWSDKPKSPIGPRQTAELYDQLMTKLGYVDYVFQGGDWGCVIGGWLGLHSRNLRALHLNGFGLRPADMQPTTEAEAQWLQQAASKQQQETAYLQLQSTKPQSLGFAMMDSPMGVAAWFAEKYHGWSDLTQNADEPPFAMDVLLDTIMIYLTTRSFLTATWIYRGMALEGGFTMPPDERVTVPAGVAYFPHDLLAFPPRTMVERGYAVAHWTDMPRGGHFAALEEPELLLTDLRQFIQTCL